MSISLPPEGAAVQAVLTLLGSDLWRCKLVLVFRGMRGMVCSLIMVCPFSESKLTHSTRPALQRFRTKPALLGSSKEVAH